MAYRDYTTAELSAMNGSRIKRLSDNAPFILDHVDQGTGKASLSGRYWVTTTQLRTEFVYHDTGLPVAAIDI